MKIYLVGGAVRDQLLGIPIKERDYVVVGATEEDMRHLGYTQVGKEFPVFLHPKTKEEYALARAERKVTAGYKGFTFDTSQEVNLENDLKRRDLTINAMAIDQETNHLIDPYGGKTDLHHKILRHVSSAFIEDPVRILRVARFYARYAYLGFRIAEETILLMQKMVALGEVNALVPERVWKEFERALLEKNPEKFFEALALCEALPILFPDLSLSQIGMKALIAATSLTMDGSIRFASLFHDLPESKKSISLLSKRYCLPNVYQELATLVAEHHEKALKARTLSADDLLDLLSALDIFRREKRFEKFLVACQAIADANKISFDPTFLMACMKTAKSVDVQELIDQGLTDQALAEQLKKRRREKIKAFINASML